MDNFRFGLNPPAISPGAGPMSMGHMAYKALSFKAPRAQASCARRQKV